MMFEFKICELGDCILVEIMVYVNDVVEVINM